MIRLFSRFRSARLFEVFHRCTLASCRASYLWASCCVLSLSRCMWMKTVVITVLLRHRKVTVNENEKTCHQRAISDLLDNHHLTSNNNKLFIVPVVQHHTHVNLRLKAIPFVTAKLLERCNPRKAKKGAGTYLQVLSWRRRRRVGGPIDGVAVGGRRRRRRRAWRRHVVRIKIRRRWTVLEERVKAVQHRSVQCFQLWSSFFRWAALRTRTQNCSTFLFAGTMLLLRASLVLAFLHSQLLQCFPVTSHNEFDTFLCIFRTTNLAGVHEFVALVRLVLASINVTIYGASRGRACHHRQHIRRRPVLLTCVKISLVTRTSNLGNKAEIQRTFFFNFLFQLFWLLSQRYSLF